MTGEPLIDRLGRTFYYDPSIGRYVLDEKDASYASYPPKKKNIVGNRIKNGRRKKEQLLEKQHNRCWLCSGEFTPEDPATWDHLLSRKSGGNNEITNLALAHALCNSLRGKGKGPGKIGKFSIEKLEEQKRLGNSAGRVSD